MKWAFNDNGILRDVVMTDPSILFPQGYADQFIEVPDDAVTGWLWDGETATPPPAPAPDPEVQWAAIRADRNQRLADCDWTQLDDTPLTNTAKQEWASYRQALRDITLQTDPFNIVWPEAPAA